MTERNTNRGKQTRLDSDTRGNRALLDTTEGIDPKVEETYWRDNFSSRPYVKKGDSYKDYGPAYRYGWERYSRADGVTFDEVESDLAEDWERTKGASSLQWERAKHATRDAWQRASDAIERATPGDSDRDGK